MRFIEEPISNRLALLVTVDLLAQLPDFDQTIVLIELARMVRERPIIHRNRIAFPFPRFSLQLSESSVVVFPGHNDLLSEEPFLNEAHKSSLLIVRTSRFSLPFGEYLKILGCSSI